MSWLVGTASANITPPIEMEMSGFVAREFGAIGVHDPLELKALTLQPSSGDPLAVIALDLIGVDDELTERIRSAVATKCGNEWAHHLAVSVTHTHGGPAMLKRSSLGEVDEGYLSFLVETSADTIARALAQSQKAHLRFGVVPEPLVARNRRDSSGPVDTDLSVLRAESYQGEAIALLVGYACHPTVLGPTNYLFSADYPGVVRRVLEQTYPGSTALFLTGCAGQINVGHDSQASIVGRGFAKRNFGEVGRVGRIVGAGAIRAAESATDAGTTGRFAEARVNLALQPQLKGEALDTLIAQLKQQRQEALAGYSGSVRMLDYEIEWAENSRSRPTQTSIPATVQAYAIGEQHGLVFLPGESFVEIGQGIKEAFPRHKLLVASYSNQIVGYIPHPSAYPQGGYEVEQAHMLFNFPAPYAPEASLHLTQSAIELFKGLRSA